MKVLLAVAVVGVVADVALGSADYAEFEYWNKTGCDEDLVLMGTYPVGTCVSGFMLGCNTVDTYDEPDCSGIPYARSTSKGTNYEDRACRSLARGLSFKTWCHEDQPDNSNNAAEVWVTNYAAPRCPVNEAVVLDKSLPTGQCQDGTVYTCGADSLVTIETYGNKDCTGAPTDTTKLLSGTCNTYSRNPYMSRKVACTRPTPKPTSEPTPESTQRNVEAAGHAAASWPVVFIGVAAALCS